MGKLKCPQMVVDWSTKHSLNKLGGPASSSSTISGISSTAMHPLLRQLKSDGLCQVGQLKVAKGAFLALAMKGLDPDVYTYTIMIKGLCKEGLLDEAYELFKKMEKDGCWPNDLSYNAMIRGFLQNNDISRAGKLVLEMASKGLSADASTVAMVVDQLCSDPTGKLSLFQKLEEFQSVNLTKKLEEGSFTH